MAEDPHSRSEGAHDEASDNMTTKSGRRVLPGQPSPLGATLTDEGVNFAVYSEGAERLELCLFDTPDGAAVETLSFFERWATSGTASSRNEGEGSFTARAHGPYEPEGPALQRRQAAGRPVRPCPGGRRQLARASSATAAVTTRRRWTPRRPAACRNVVVDNGFGGRRRAAGVPWNER